jgi:hypothetical protein
LVVEAALAVTGLEEPLLKAAQEVQEEEDTYTSVIRGSHQTTVVLRGPKTSLVVSRSTLSATLWARTAATKRVERTDASRERECK